MIGTSFNRVNAYGNALVPYASETTVLSYVVPTGHTFNIREVRVWGDFFGEVLVKVNGVQVAGDRIHCTERRKDMIFREEPIPVTSNGVISVNVIHDDAHVPNMANIKFNAHLLGELN